MPLQALYALDLGLPQKTPRVVDGAFRRLLVPDADRDDPGLRDLLPGELVAHKEGYQGGHVGIRYAPNF